MITMRTSNKVRKKFGDMAYPLPKYVSGTTIRPIILMNALACILLTNKYFNAPMKVKLSGKRFF